MNAFDRVDGCGEVTKWVTPVGLRLLPLLLLPSGADNASS